MSSVKSLNCNETLSFSITFRVPETHKTKSHRLSTWIWVTSVRQKVTDGVDLVVWKWLTKYGWRRRHGGGDAGVWFQIQNVRILIRPAVQLWRQIANVISRAVRHLTVGVVRCYKQSATLGVCWSQSSSAVLTTSKSNRKRASFSLYEILVEYVNIAKLKHRKTRS